jgi:AraC-like DNA-binding protein
MADDPGSLTTRLQRREAAEARREAKAAYREALFQALASGWTARQIADARKVSVRTVQREIDRAVAERRLDAPDRFVHLQVARLTKALRVADIGLDQGELAAIAPLVKVVAALERYHRPMAPSAPVHAPLADLPMPAPLLALTQAAPPLDDLAAEHETATDFHT